jgi:hypothetical protein
MVMDELHKKKLIELMEQSLVFVDLAGLKTLAQ